MLSGDASVAVQNSWMSVPHIGYSVDKREGAGSDLRDGILRKREVLH